MSVHSCIYIEYPWRHSRHGTHTYSYFSRELIGCHGVVPIRGRLHICNKGGKYKIFTLKVPPYMNNTY